jgi:hypothetical protein
MRSKKRQMETQQRPSHGINGIKHGITHVPAPSASLRTKGPGTSVDVRLCRLRAKDPATAAPAPIRLPGDNREPGRASGVLLVVDERGRIEDEASLGSTEFLRAPALGAPEARFLRDKCTARISNPAQYGTKRYGVPLLNHISFER